MKIYQAILHLEESNQYVSSLIHSIDSQFGDVVWGYGLEKFWSDDIFDFDIVHIHWPHKLLKHYSAFDFEQQLSKIKNKGIKIVSTCHNLTPHYCADKNFIESYNIAYSYSDMILHLGTWSLNLFRNRYRNAKNVLLPHHIYDEVYTNFFTKKESCKKLKLPYRAKYILCLGVFRDEEERSIVKQIAKHYRFQNVYVIVSPSYGVLSTNRIIRVIEYYWIKYRHHIIVTSRKDGRLISTQEIPYYYGAADVAFIHRKKNLNSGNVLLAFLFGKVVVGPKIGNIKNLLLETENPTFNVDDCNSLLDAVDRGLLLSKEKKGEKNKIYTQIHFSTKKIAAQLHYYYEELLKKC